MCFFRFEFWSTLFSTRSFEMFFSVSRVLDENPMSKIWGKRAPCCPQECCSFDNAAVHCDSEALKVDVAAKQSTLGICKVIFMY